MFRLYAFENLTLEGIVKRFADDDINYRPSTPRWSRTSVHNMLTYRAYIGEIRYRTGWYPGKDRRINTCRGWGVPPQRRGETPLPRSDSYLHERGWRRDDLGSFDGGQFGEQLTEPRGHWAELAVADHSTIDFHNRREFPHRAGAEHFIGSINFC